MFITKCDRLLLQSASGIVQRNNYYKKRRNKSTEFTGFWEILLKILESPAP